MQQVHAQEYNRASLIGIGILIILTWGFYRTYLMFFPTFEGFLIVQHFHGAIMVLWIALLIIQPWLMSRKKYGIHRAIGKTSFILAPLVVLSIFLITKAMYHANLQRLPAPSDAVAITAISLPPAVIFAILYSLAIANRQRTYYHMRYMIGTGILMIGPGVGRLIRLYLELPMGIGAAITLATVALAGLVFLVLDLVHKRNSIPNLIVTGLLVLHLIIWQIRYTPLWQKPAEIFASVFF
ncbi:MAG TPA: hypothetical protein VF191_06700 [Cyclobacteriaceae bacterium]